MPRPAQQREMPDLGCVVLTGSYMCPLGGLQAETFAVACQSSEQQPAHIVAEGKVAEATVHLSTGGHLRLVLATGLVSS